MQHMVATLFQHCFELQHCSNITKLCYAKNRLLQRLFIIHPNIFMIFIQRAVRAGKRAVMPRRYAFVTSRISCMWNRVTSIGATF